MKIEPVPTTFLKLISSTFVHVPQFQRPYSWKAEHVEELWDDLIGARGQDYFVGSLVFYDHPKEPAGVYVTDGQQRLTTLTIALCALRDISNEAGLSNVATGIQNLVERTDVDNKKRFFIKYGNSNKYLADCILATAPTTTEPESDEEKAQRQAFRQLRRRAESHLIENFGAAWVSHAGAEKRIVEIRNTILNILFISLTLSGEEEAYVVFETLNSRGMDLEVSDLLKNLLSRLIKKPNKDVSPVSVIWDEVRGRFHGLSNAASFDTFLLHYWLSQVNFVSKKDLFKDMKTKIGKAKAESWLEDIRKKSRAYAKLASPADYNWSKEERELTASLDALNRFGVQQARPLTLSLVHQYEANKNVSLKQAKRAVGSIENFAYQFNAITQSRGGGGITLMYSNLARACAKVATAQEFSDFVKEMVQKFKDREIDRDEFIVNFRRLEYSNEQPRDRALVRYTLQRLHEHFTKKSAVDYDQYNVEHLCPQSSGVPHEYYANIGNLIFLPETLNEKLGDKPFPKKISALKAAQETDPFMVDWSDANEEAIKARAQALAEVAFDKVWSL